MVEIPISASYNDIRCSYHRKEGETPLLGTPDTGHFKRYSRCRDLVRRMPVLEQTRFGCHELKSKNNYYTYYLNTILCMLISEHKGSIRFGCCLVLYSRHMIGANILFLLLLDETVQAVNKV